LHGKATICEPDKIFINRTFTFDKSTSRADPVTDVKTTLFGAHSAFFMNLYVV